jgi:hypothetical protein
MAKKPSESTNQLWSKIKSNIEKIRIQDLNSEARQKPTTWGKHQNPRNSHSAVKQSPKNPKPKPEFHATLQIFHVKKEKIFCKMQDTQTHPRQQIKTVNAPNTKQDISNPRALKKYRQQVQNP